MTTPQPQQSSPDGMLAQILLEQGRQGTQLAVIIEQLKDLPDHETRIRDLTAAIPARLEARLSSLETAVPTRLEERLSSLETARAKLLGAALVLSLLASAGGTWIALLIAQH